VAAAHDRERALVLAALAGAVERAWPLEEGLEGLDWEWLLGRLGEHALGARFWAEAQAAGRLMAAIPPATRALLEADAEAVAAHGARLVHLALQASAALDAAGISSMPMKGVALLLGAPGFGAARAMSDVDLLVRPRDLRRAADALAPLFPSRKVEHEYDGAERDVDEALRGGIASLYTFCTADGAVLELHHAFPGVRAPGAAEAAFDRGRTLVHRCQAVRVPSLDDLLGSACVHVLEHHFGTERGMLLRHVADVRLLVASGASPERATALYDAGGGDTVARSLALLAGAREEACRRGAPRSVASLTLDGLDAQVGSWARNLATRIDRIWGSARRHGLRTVFPPRSFMVGLYGPAAEGPGLPLLHLHRWGAILVRTLRGRP